MRLVGFVLTIGLSAMIGFGQAVVYIEDNNPANGNANAIPFSFQNYTSLHVYLASQLRSQGACPGDALTDFAVAPAASGLFTGNNSIVQVGHLSVSPPIAGQWTTNLSSPVTIWDTTVNGPLSFSYGINQWSSLPGFATGSFVWDGVSDIGVIWTNATASVTGGFSARTTSTNVRYGVGTFNATNQVATSFAPAAMKARLTFSGGAPSYQLNQANASFDFGGVVGQACDPAVATSCGPGPVNANVSSPLTGNGWDLVADLGSGLVPLGGGGFSFGSAGQIVNVNLGSPTLLILNGFTFPPFPGNFSVPLSALPPFTVAGQFVILDATQPDGARLSSGAELRFQNVGSISGPVTNDAFTEIVLGAPPLCGPSSIQFYGVTYSSIFVSTNGRVTFGTGSASATPGVTSVLSNPPFVGNWCDLNQALGGTISVTSSSPTNLRIDYVGVPYVGQPTTANTFSIEFDTSANSITLGGLNGLQAHPTSANSLVGLSPGSNASNPGGLNFAPPNSAAGANSITPHYSFGAAGTLTMGLFSIVFTQNAGFGYDWQSF